MDNKLKEELNKYIEEICLNYGKITFTVQGGKLLDEIVETRTRI